MGNIAIIATARVKAGCEASIAEWQSRHSVIISRAPGFVSSDMIPPPASQPGDPWTLILTFLSQADAEAWQRSPARTSLLDEIAPLLHGNAFTETLRPQSEEAPGNNVTEVIFSKVRPGMEEHYREWATRIQAAQALYPGYRGMHLQPPANGKSGGHWTSILRYETPAQLEAWMNSPERKALISEASEFIENEEFMHLSTAFPGWVPIDPTTGEGPPNWKAALLVLLGLFPIVMLEMKFLHLDQFGIPSSPATFLGNAISVGLTSFITMPLFVKWFEWWLFPKGTPKQRSATTSKGVSILAILFTAEVLLLWKLLPW